MRQREQAHAGELTLMPYIVKTDLFGPGSEKHRFAAELGRLLVPENRHNPQSALIELAFIRLKSTAEHPGPPLVILAGGPGVPGSEWAHFDAFVPWFTALRTVCDVILLDQRGTGLSNPRLDGLERWDLPLDQPGDRETFLRLATEHSRQSVSYWQEQGVDLAGYTTWESADDLDALRQALGLDQICLYGASYGSHLALATLRRHGAHIARAVIALVEGPDHTLKLPSNTQRQLEHLAELVRQDQRLSQAIPDLLGLMRSVLERLAQQPVEVLVDDKEAGQRVRVVLGEFDAQMITASGLGDRSFLQRLPARYCAMSRGDFSWLAQETLKLRRDWVGNAMSFVMDCASGASAERLAQIEREAAHALLGDVMDLPFPYVCSAWGSPDLGAEFRSPITSDVPVLFMTGSLDGRTPPSNVAEVMPGFSNSLHIVIEGGTHSTPKLVAVPAIRDLMVSFLRGETVANPHASIPFVFTSLDE